MPNWVKTVLNFEGPTKSINALKKKIKREDNSISSEFDEGAIDFEKIVPSPKTKEKCPKKYLVTENSHIGLIKGKEFLDWYKFNIENWGTKWNARDSIWTGDATLTFETAWAFPTQVLIKLSKMYPKIKIHFEFADEDVSSSNCAEGYFENGAAIITWSPNSSEESIKFSCNLWGYPEENYPY